MLGEMIGEDQGRITGIRVLPAAGTDAQLEVSFQSSGRMLGVEFTEMGSYLSSLSPGGYMHGKGQGILTTHDGDLVTWTGEGVGKPTGKGSAASWRGAIYYQTSSKRLAQLNGLCGVFEHEVDEAGNARTRVFEWK